jgi:hypothetical protein
MQVVELPGSTRTALEAAQAVGCQSGRLKSCLQIQETQQPVLVLARASRVTSANRSPDRRAIGQG